MRVETDEEIRARERGYQKEQEKSEKIREEQKRIGTGVSIFDDVYKKVLKLKPFHPKNIEDVDQRENWLDLVTQIYIELTKTLKELGFEQYETESALIEKK